MTGAVFDDLIGRLAGHPCIAPDLPGHGCARGLPPTAEAWAACIAETIAPLHAPVLVGWSMGAAAVWHYLGAHGTRGIAGLVTVDMSPRMRPAPDWPHGLLGGREAAIEDTARRIETDWEGASHGIAASMFAGAAEAPRDAARRVILSQDPQAMRAAWETLGDMDARADVPGIALPWLVCSGAQSRVYPASASDWIADHAPHARRLVFRQSGHSPHLEEPEAFARVLRAFAKAV